MPGNPMDIQSIVKELDACWDEPEWFEFKENRFRPEALIVHWGRKAWIAV